MIAVPCVSNLKILALALKRRRLNASVELLECHPLCSGETVRHMSLKGGIDGFRDFGPGKKRAKSDQC